MLNNDPLKKTIIRDLGDGLILRRSTRADADALAEFNAAVHKEPDSDQPEERVAAWVRDLIEKPHPTFDVGDFTLVEDRNEGKIVSSLNLIPQTWTYAGIPFGVGRPELVGTLPEYRNRGLVRLQFDVVHQWSAGRGEKVQAITGIPYYYRLFGYEMGLTLGGGRAGYKPQVPVLKEGETEPYQVRPASEADVGFIDEVYRRSCKRGLVNCVWDQALWRYELNGKSEKNVNRLALRLIETPQGERVGFLAHPPYSWGSMMPAAMYELKPGISWAAVTPTVIRYLQQTGQELLAGKEKEQFEAFGFWHGEVHPVYKVIEERLPRVRKPYAWYVRVPDLPGFLQHITPVLEERLENSELAGHSGELKITFYRSGLRLVFEKGNITTIEAWKPEPLGHSGNAGFPELTFLQLLFGYRSLEELKYAFADCWTRQDEAAALLNVLFPKQASNVMPIS